MAIDNLLVELFVEELPPKALQKLGDAFAQELVAQLRAQGLATAESVVTPFASPRRLAAHISQVWRKAADKAVSQKLMPASVGLDAHGQPTRCAAPLTARTRSCFLIAWQPALPWTAACKRRWKKRWPNCRSRR